MYILLILVLMLATLSTVFIGLCTTNQILSNRMMVARVILQTIIVLLVCAV